MPLLGRAIRFVRGAWINRHVNQKTKLPLLTLIISRYWGIEYNIISTLLLVYYSLQGEHFFKQKLINRFLAYFSFLLVTIQNTDVELRVRDRDRFIWSSFQHTCKIIEIIHYTCMMGLMTFSFYPFLTSSQSSFYQNIV